MKKQWTSRRNGSILHFSDGMTRFVTNAGRKGRTFASVDVLVAVLSRIVQKYVKKQNGKHIVNTSNIFRKRQCLGHVIHSHRSLLNCQTKSPRRNFHLIYLLSTSPEKWRDCMLRCTETDVKLSENQ